MKKMLAVLLVVMLALPMALTAGAEGVPEGSRRLTLYWTSEEADYATCDVWIWFPGKDGSGHLLEPCDYGVKVSVDVPEDVSEVGFIVRKDCSDPCGSSWGNATKDFEDDRFAILTGKNTEIYLQAGDGMQYTSPDGGKTLNPIKIFQLAGIISMTEIKYFINPAMRIESLDQVHVRLDGKEIPVEKLSSLNSGRTLRMSGTTWARSSTGTKPSSRSGRRQRRPSP